IDEIGPLPPMGSVVQSLEDAARHYRDSAEDLFEQGVQILDMPDRGAAMDDVERERCHAALRLFRQALAKRKDFTDAYLNAGLCYVRLTRYQEALASFRQVLRLCPDDIMAHYSSIGLHVLLGRRADAEAEARETVRLCPEFAPAHFMLGALCAD